MNAATVPEPATLTAALEYAGRGWPVFPVNGKIPCTAHGFKDATTTEHVVRLMFGTWPDAGVAIRTGAASGLVVLDVDQPLGEETLEELEGEHGRLPKTPVGLTGGGGQHYLFRHPGRPVKSVNGKLGAGLDVKADGGYVVAPPSAHASGRWYEWNGEAHPDDVSPAWLPPWIETGANGTPKPETPASIPPRKTNNGTGTTYGDAALDREIEAFRFVGRGERHDALYRAAASLGELVAGGELNRSAVEHGLQDACQANGLFAEGRACEVLRTIAEGLEKGAGNPRTATSPIAEVKERLSPIGDIQPADEEDKPDILVPGLHPDGSEVTTFDFAKQVTAALPGGALYKRGPHVGTIEGERGGRKFEEISDERVRKIVDRHVRLCRWTKPKKEGDSPALSFLACNRDHARLVRDEALRHGVIRDLVTLTSHPVVVGEDYDAPQPGWNQAHSLFYDQPPGLHDIEVVADRDAIHAVLSDLVVDFPFKDEASRQNFVGLLLTAIMRPSMPDALPPLHIFGSSIERTGKTKLACQVFGGVTAGQTAAAQPWPTSEDERDKRILSVLRRGDTSLVVDNLHTGKVLDSGVLAALVTQASYTGRTLCKNEMPVYRNNLTVLLTGNNVRCSSEKIFAARQK